MIIDEIKAANIKAMKERDNVTRGVLSIVMTKYKNMEVELRAQGKEIGDKEMLQIIQKTIKELADEKEGYIKVNNQERVDSLAKQEEVLEEYLPKQLSQEEIKQVILSLEDRSVPNVMKHFKMNYAGQVDMALVNSVLRSL